jgi:hypothetical protein
VGDELGLNAAAVHLPVGSNLRVRRNGSFLRIEIPPLRLHDPEVVYGGVFASLWLGFTTVWTTSAVRQGELTVPCAERERQKVWSTLRTTGGCRNMPTFVERVAVPPLINSLWMRIAGAPVIFVVFSAPFWFVGAHLVHQTLVPAMETITLTMDDVRFELGREWRGMDVSRHGGFTLDLMYVALLCLLVARRTRRRGVRRRTAMQKWRIGLLGFGWEMSSRGRFATPARTKGYTFTTIFLASSLVQGPFSVNPNRSLSTLIVRFATLTSLYVPGTLGRPAQVVASSAVVTANEQVQNELRLFEGINHHVMGKHLKTLEIQHLQHEINAFLRDARAIRFKTRAEHEIPG